MRAFMAGSDVFRSIPTGAGKSLHYCSASLCILYALGQPYTSVLGDSHQSASYTSAKTLAVTFLHMTL